MLKLFTEFHVAISLIGIISGFAVMFAMPASKYSSKMTALFLSTTIATSVTGFFFPVEHFMPSHGVGILSLIVLAVTVVALYKYHLARSWRWIYVVTALIGQFFNVFVLIVQSFLKVPALHALAPTQTEQPFAIAQGSSLVFFVIFGIIAVIKFRPIVEPSGFEAPAAKLAA